MPEQDKTAAAQAKAQEKAEGDVAKANEAAEAARAKANAETDPEKIVEATKAADAAEAEAARVAAAANLPAEDPTTEATTQFSVLRTKRTGKSKYETQSSAMGDVVASFEEEPAVELGSGVSADQAPRVPYGVVL